MKAAGASPRPTGKDGQNTLFMTDFEICQEYLQAKSRVKQIKVLADLCQTSPKAIREILDAGGVLKAAEHKQTCEKRHYWSTEESEKLMQLRDEGKTFTQIAMLLGRTEIACSVRFNKQRRLKG